MSPAAPSSPETRVALRFRSADELELVDDRAVLADVYPVPR